MEEEEADAEESAVTVREQRLNKNGRRYIFMVMPRRRSVSVAPSQRSRMSTPALEEESGHVYADATCPIAMFDERGAASQVPSEAEAQRDGKGYSRNTVKALGLLRGELQVEEEAAENIMSFNEMATKVGSADPSPNIITDIAPCQASRRAASAFFFELLLLSTKDFVRVTQEGPFENIEIHAKEKLWADQRGLSVAPTSSIGGSGSQSQV